MSETAWQTEEPYVSMSDEDFWTEFRRRFEPDELGVLVELRVLVDPQEDAHAKAERLLAKAGFTGRATGALYERRLGAYKL